jgi:hypothetical protein
VGATVREGHLFISTMSSKGLAGVTETFVRYGVTPRLELGFGYLWRQGYVRPLTSYSLIPETAAQPSLTVGLMTDSLGGGREGGFISLAKDFGARYGVPASFYIGGAQISSEDGLRFLAGLKVRLPGSLIASAQFDGRFVHLGATVAVGRINGAPVRLGIVAARGDRLGPLIAINLPLAY